MIGTMQQVSEAWTLHLLLADRSGALKEKMLVWAVDGLAGVILGGVVGANTSRQVRKPRSLLWGSHEGQLKPWSGVFHKFPWLLGASYRLSWLFTYALSLLLLIKLYTKPEECSLTHNAL